MCVKTSHFVWQYLQKFESDHVGFTGAHFRYCSNGGRRSRPGLLSPTETQHVRRRRRRNSRNDSLCHCAAVLAGGGLAELSGVTLQFGSRSRARSGEGIKYANTRLFRENCKESIKIVGARLSGIFNCPCVRPAGSVSLFGN